MKYFSLRAMSSANHRSGLYSRASSPHIFFDRCITFFDAQNMSDNPKTQCAFSMEFLQKLTVGLTERTVPPGKNVFLMVMPSLGATLGRGTGATRQYQLQKIASCHSEG